MQESEWKKVADSSGLGTGLEAWLDNPSVLTRDKRGVLTYIGSSGDFQCVNGSRSNCFSKQTAQLLASSNTLAGKTIACRTKPQLQERFRPFPQIKSGKRKIWEIWIQQWSWVPSGGLGRQVGTT